MPWGAQSLVNPGRIQPLGREGQKELLEFCTREVGMGPSAQGQA